MYSARFGIGFWSPYAARYSPDVLRHDPESEPSSREIKVTPLLRLRFCNSLWRDPSEREEKHQQDDNDGDADNSEPDSSLKDVDDRVASGQGGQKQEEERSEEHTSELQSRGHLVCRLLLEKKNSAG